MMKPTGNIDLKIFKIPYDFTLPTPKKIVERLWNENDDKVFPPHIFGIGWSINFCALLKKIR